MKRYSLVLVAVLAVAALGAGCFSRVRPRVVQTPPERPTSQIAKQATSTAPERDRRFEDTASSTGMAYLRLNGGSADITRGGVTLAAVDGLELASGDRLAVTTGTVYVTYPDSGASQLDAGTDIVLSTDDSQPGMVMQLELLAGRVWTRFERLFGGGEYYAVSANGVVATVRGTAFGMGVEDGDVDVQVADHEVEITAGNDNPSEWTAGRVTQAIRISAGQGLKIAARGALPDMERLRTGIRRLNAQEQLAKGFKFGVTKLLPERLRRPARPIRLNVPPVMTPELLRYRELLLRRAAIMQAASSTFVAPLRAPTLQETTAPTTSPKVMGPSG